MRIGIDLGGTKIAAGLVDPDGAIIREESIATRSAETFEDLVGAMDRLCRVVASGDLLAVKSVGVGVPGAVDRGRGTILYMPNIDLEDAPLGSALGEALDLPVKLDNDANCAALAEARAGAAKGTRHSVTVTLGTGIGGGIIIDGKIYAGFNGVAGELGHMVIQEGGPECGCGRRGCFEACASTNALIRMAREAMAGDPDGGLARLVGGDPARINGHTPFEAADAGDPGAQAVLDRWFELLAEGLANLVNIFQPEVLVIGGAVSRRGEKLLGPVRPLMEERAYSGRFPRTRLVTAALGNKAGILGAAYL